MSALPPRAPHAITAAELQGFFRDAAPGWRVPKMGHLVPLQREITHLASARANRQPQPAQQIRGGEREQEVRQAIEVLLTHIPHILTRHGQPLADLTRAGAALWEAIREDHDPDDYTRTLTGLYRAAEAAKAADEASGTVPARKGDMAILAPRLGALIRRAWQAAGQAKLNPATRVYQVIERCINVIDSDLLARSEDGASAIDRIKKVIQRHENRDATKSASVPDFAVKPGQSSHQRRHTRETE